jgi:hypothetical protein
MDKLIMKLNKWNIIFIKHPLNHQYSKKQIPLKIHNLKSTLSFHQEIIIEHLQKMHFILSILIIQRKLNMNAFSKYAHKV